MSLPAPETLAPSTRRTEFQPYLPLMAVTTIIWGAAFPISKPALADFPPATFALSRFMLAGAVLLPIMLIRQGGWHFSGRVWAQVAFAGFMGFTVIQLCQNWGLTLSSASDISVLAATEPVTIALLAALFLGEKPSPAVWLGLLISLVGVWFVIGINPLSLIFGTEAGSGTGGNNRIIGDLVFVAGTLGFSTYNVINRSLAQRYNGLELTTGAVLCGIAGLIPFCLFELITGTRPIRFSGSVAVGVLYTALLVTVFGFLALSWSLKRVPAAKVALLFYLQPLSGVAVAWLGGEQLGWNLGLGATLIFAGVYLAERRGRVVNREALATNKAQIEEGPEMTS